MGNSLKDKIWKKRFRFLQKLFKEGNNSKKAKEIMKKLKKAKDIDELM